MAKDKDPVKRDDLDVEKAKRGWLQQGDDEWLLALQDLRNQVKEEEDGQG